MGIQFRVSCVHADSAQVKISCVSRVPADSLHPLGFTYSPSGLLVSSSTQSRLSSVTPPWPVELSALPWLLYHHPYSFTGLPHPFGCALVRHYSACATKFRAVHCTLSLHRSAFPSAPPRSSVLSAPPQTLINAAPLVSPFPSALCLSLGLHLHQPHLRQHPAGVDSQNFTMTPPSIDSAVGFHPGCALGPHQAPPAPGSYLAPPSSMGGGRL